MGVAQFMARNRNAVKVRTDVVCCCLVDRCAHASVVRDMSAAKTKKPKTSTNPEAQGPNAAAPADNQEPEASGKPAKSGKTTTRPGMKILSVAIPDKLARQVRLLCTVEGTSAQALVESALRRAVAKRLSTALESISKADADVEPE